MNAKLPKLPAMNPALAANAAAAPAPAPPPPPQQAPVLGVAGDYEAKTVEIDWPFFAETLVYQTTKRWRACDVYVDLPATQLLPSAFTVSVFVYAVSQGARTLVASGRTRYTGGVGPFQQFRPNSWMVAARSVAERYEVTARVDLNQAVPLPSGRFAVTVAASDEMTNPPDEIGQFSTVGIGGIDYTPVGETVPPVLELMSVRAVNTSAAPRYLFLFDTLANVAPAGQAAMIWPLGPGAGYGVTDDNVRYRSRYAPLLLVSSDGITFTQAADCTVTAAVR